MVTGPDLVFLLLFSLDIAGKSLLALCFTDQLPAYQVKTKPFRNREEEGPFASVIRGLLILVCWFERGRRWWSTVRSLEPKNR